LIGHMNARHVQRRLGGAGQLAADMDGLRTRIGEHNVSAHDVQHDDETNSREGRGAEDTGDESHTGTVVGGRGSLRDAAHARTVNSITPTPHPTAVHHPPLCSTTATPEPPPRPSHRHARATATPEPRRPAAPW